MQWIQSRTQGTSEYICTTASCRHDEPDVVVDEGEKSPLVDLRSRPDLEREPGQVIRRLLGLLLVGAVRMSQLLFAFARRALAVNQTQATEDDVLMQIFKDSILREHPDRS